MATRKGHFDIVQKLLEAGAIINHKNKVRVINPRRACAARVTVVVSVRLSVSR